MKTLAILVAGKIKNEELAMKIGEVAGKNGFEPIIINLVDFDFPLYSALEEQRGGIPQTAVSLMNQLETMDSLAVVAPEYNGGIPPVLTNTISWISRADDDWRKAFNGKPTLIATHSGGGGLHVLMAMRQQLSYIGANVLGREIQTNFGKELSLETLESCLSQL